MGGTLKRRRQQQSVGRLEIEVLPQARGPRQAGGSVDQPDLSGVPKVANVSPRRAQVEIGAARKDPGQSRLDADGVKSKVG